MPSAEMDVQLCCAMLANIAFPTAIQTTKEYLSRIDYIFTAIYRGPFALKSLLNQPSHIISFLSPSSNSNKTESKKHITNSVEKPYLSYRISSQKERRQNLAREERRIFVYLSLYLAEAKTYTICEGKRIFPYSSPCLQTHIRSKELEREEIANNQIVR